MTDPTPEARLREALGRLGDQAAPAGPFERFELQQPSDHQSASSGPGPFDRPLLAVAAAVLIAAGIGGWAWLRPATSPIESGPAGDGLGTEQVPPDPTDDEGRTAPDGEDGDEVGAAPDDPSSESSSTPHGTTDDVTATPEPSAIAVVPPAELAVMQQLMDLTGADAAVWWLPAADSTAVVWDGGSSTRIEPSLVDRADEEFLFPRPTSEEGSVIRVLDYGGAEVCRFVPTDDPNVWEWVHHATRRDDGSVVLGIGRQIGEHESGGTEVHEGDAYDCDTGDRTPIEPFTATGGESASTLIERPGGRRLVIEGDAEGNASAIRNDHGIDIAGDSYPGSLDFSSDGRWMAFGDHAEGVSHWDTNWVSVRSTDDGSRRWTQKLPGVVRGVMVVGDRVVVGQSDDAMGGVDDGLPDRLMVLDLVTGDRVGEVQAPAGYLVHLGQGRFVG